MEGQQSTNKRSRSPSLEKEHLTLVIPEKKLKLQTNKKNSINVPSAKPDKLLSLQRKVFSKLRSPNTTPATELPNGQIAGIFATEYILTTHQNRSNKKDKGD